MLLLAEVAGDGLLIDLREGFDPPSLGPDDLQDLIARGGRAGDASKPATLDQRCRGWRDRKLAVLAQLATSFGEDGEYPEPYPAGLHSPLLQNERLLRHRARLTTPAPELLDAATISTALGCARQSPTFSAAASASPVAS